MFESKGIPNSNTEPSFLSDPDASSESNYLIRSKVEWKEAECNDQGNDLLSNGFRVSTHAQMSPGTGHSN